MGVVRTDDLDLIPETTGFVRRALHYYVPCVVRGRMVAVIGLGRSADGALLSSEDVEILRTVSGYVAVAIENSLLYQEQQERATEMKLLQEFTSRSSSQSHRIARGGSGRLRHAPDSAWKKFRRQS